MSDSIRPLYHQSIKKVINLLMIFVPFLLFFSVPSDSSQFWLTIGSSVCVQMLAVSALILSLFDFKPPLSTVLTLLSLVVMAFSAVLCFGGLDSLILYLLPILVLLAAMLTHLRETMIFSISLSGFTVAGVLLSKSTLNQQPLVQTVFTVWLMAAVCMMLIFVIDRQHRQQSSLLLEQIETNSKLHWLLKCEENYAEHLYQVLSANIRREQSMFSTFLKKLKQQPETHPLERPIQILHDQMFQLANYVETESSVTVSNKPTSMKLVHQSLNDIFGSPRADSDVHIYINSVYQEEDSLNVDLARLEQVWINLFNNSVRYTSEGTIRIDLLKEEARYRFQFFDTGCGIPEPEQERIFTLFEQGKTNEHAEGLGIGLALASRILNQFNSRLYLKSIEGKGTLFWFFIDIEHIAEKVT